MNRLQKASLLGVLAEKLRQNGSWSGETHIQKATYFLEELFGIETDFNFILYKHGPYSFDLKDELTSLTADGLLELETRPYPYGPSLVPTAASRQLWKEFPKTIGRYERAISFIAESFDEKGVAELERLSTALYVTRELPGESRERLAERIRELKPHVAQTDALQALDALDTMVRRLPVEAASVH